MHNSSVIYTYIYSFHIIFHYSLLQDTVYNSQCYVEGPCCLSILHIVVYICKSQMSNLSLLLPTPKYRTPVCTQEPGTRFRDRGSGGTRLPSEPLGGGPERADLGPGIPSHLWSSPAAPRPHPPVSWGSLGLAVPRTHRIQAGFFPF